MSRRVRRKKCKHCQCLFRPDPRNHKRQKFCSKPECRKASKAYSQKKWPAKKENRDYFRGPEHVKRVQRWRKNHPGYRRTERPDKDNALQNPLIQKDQQNPGDDQTLTLLRLQDLLSRQELVLKGLIAHLMGTPLQDDIDEFLVVLGQLGRDIGFGITPNKGARHDPKDSHRLPPTTARAETI